MLCLLLLFALLLIIKASNSLLTCHYMGRNDRLCLCLTVVFVSKCKCLHFKHKAFARTGHIDAVRNSYIIVSCST